ncbi:phospholipid methyltransferase-domain-containing protein [Auriculariales sp. MPI-PUGE-AT-0066]|nr:phospholipid methyltransferase-domain-containing protein [Auriculariales sp. MPI-PUGE-AT-0066]
MSSQVRQRKSAAQLARTPSASPTPSPSSRSVTPTPIVYGKTPDGIVFPVPTTQDVLTALFHPAHPKSHLDLVNLTLLAAQLAIFWVLPRQYARTFFLAYFAFWRLAYDLGLGIVLTKQSKRRWIVKLIEHAGWLDPQRKPKVRDWIRAQLQGKMGSDYSFDQLPVEYNTWLLFRQLVDIILLNDFLAYCMFAFACFRVPSDLSVTVHALRWLGGIILIVFNLWVKTEAHHVVKDYGWYWGDCFFERGSLIFDGVFEMAPHPMYSVGYAGYYGLSLIVGSYPVLFASLAAHAAQFAFLNFFENPHIDRTYGQRKPLSARTHIAGSDDAPPNRVGISSSVEINAEHSESDATSATAVMSDSDLTSASDSEGTLLIRPERRSMHKHRNAPPRKLTQHDMLNKYFRKDPVGIFNLDLFRAADFKLLLTIFYSGLLIMASSVPPSFILPLHFLHAVGWRIFHSFVLGYLLKAQSQTKYLVRHFVKHYYYPPTSDSAESGAVTDAFNNWKEVYNLSLCMTYVSFFGLAWHSYVLVPDWTVGDQLLRHVVGAILIFLHAWTAMECYSVTGVFGWFFGDFFIDQKYFPATLDYTGIYRFLNNPERTASGAAFVGLALMSSSKLAFFLAVLSHLSHGWFITNVETPHMRKLYGDTVRQDAGLTRMLKKIAKTNGRLLELSADKHAPELKKKAYEIKETLEKAVGQTTVAVDQLIAKTRPVLDEVVSDTRELLEKSRKRLIIPRMSSDVSQYDLSHYGVEIRASQVSESLRFHLGEPIEISWRAPANHSRKDWIGIYRVGANSLTAVTDVNSQGHWLGVFEEEWEGGVALNQGDASQYGASGIASGTLIFSQALLPMVPAQYELRYHHDGGYNVMATGDPIEIYVEPPTQLEFAHIRAWLLRIVRWCLNNDPQLMPKASLTSGNYGDGSGEQDDDFRFWDETQAQQIADIIKVALDVDYSDKVIIAHANVTSLARRIMASKQLLQSA